MEQQAQMEKISKTDASEDLDDLDVGSDESPHVKRKFVDFTALLHTDDKTELEDILKKDVRG